MHNTKDSAERWWLQDVGAALVVLSPNLSGESLLENLGSADRTWSVGDVGAAGFSGWELHESAATLLEVPTMLEQLIGRAQQSRVALDELRTRDGNIVAVTLRIWADTKEDSVVLPITASIVSGLARLGAAIDMSVSYWPQEPAVDKGK